VRVNGLEFNVRVHGEGTSLLWGHGLSGSMDSEDAFGVFRWQDFPPDCQLIRYDARGHGGSAATYAAEDYRWSNLAGDMLAIAEALVDGPLLLGGQSMGAATALHAALQAHTCGLVLVNPPTAWELRARQAAGYRRMARVGGLLGGRILSVLAPLCVRRAFPPCLLQAPRENLVALAQGVKSISRKTFPPLFTGAALSDLPSRERIATIDVPALILAWEADPAHPLSVAAELGRLLPRSKLVVASSYAGLQQWHRLIREFVAGVLAD